jgi:hypothetical protein
MVQVTCAQAGLSSTQCRDTAGGLDLGSPLKSALHGFDPTFGAAATPFGIGNGFDGVPDVEELQTQSPSKNINVQYNGRVDYQASEKDRIAFSSYFTPVSSKYYNGPQLPANNWNHSQIAESWTGLYTRTISPTMLNEARFSANGWNWNETNSNPQEPFGLPTANFSSIGNVNIQSLGAQTPSQFDQLTYNGRDTLTKIQNSHPRHCSLGGRTELPIPQPVGFRQRRSLCGERHQLQSGNRCAHDRPKESALQNYWSFCAGRLESEEEPDRQFRPAVGILFAIDRDQRQYQQSDFRPGS